MPIITLLTDFGLADSYVGQMKGVILSLNPHTTIVDITHAIPPGNVLSGAFQLRQAIPFFPDQTIHVGIVDPGVGSSRKALLIETDRCYFIGPDNGLFSPAISSLKIRRCIEITDRKYMLRNISPTFHGRDLFAPVAAFLSLGVDPKSFGRTVRSSDSIYKLRIPEPVQKKEYWLAEVLHVDRFGNILLSLSESLIHEISSIQIGKKAITKKVKTFADLKPREMGMLLGSSEYLELVQNQGSAAQALHLSTGDKLKVHFLNEG